MTADELDALVERMKALGRFGFLDDCNTAAQALTALREERDAARAANENMGERYNRLLRLWSDTNDRALAAETALAEERELCAQIAETGAKKCGTGAAEWHRGFRYAAINTALSIASAIRARGELTKEK